LNLAYHGRARRTNHSTSASSDGSIRQSGQLDIVPQEYHARLPEPVLERLLRGSPTRRCRRLAQRSRFLVLTTQVIGSEVEIRVRDNGVGMTRTCSTSCLRRSSRRAHRGGTGLGLSLSYDTVVHQHGGQLLVESEPNDHTEFIVRLPRKIPVKTSR